MRFLSLRRGIAGEPAADPPPQERLARTILDTLEAALPNALSVEELAARIPGSDAAGLRAMCLGAAVAGAVQPHVHAPDLATTLQGRPLASAVARAQIGHGTSVTNLRHALVEMDDELARRMLPLLDGTRDAAALAAALNQPPAAIDAHLRHFAKVGLLA